MTTISTQYCITLLLVTTFLFVTQELAYSTDTIKTSQILRDNGTTLISSNGSFELGFYSPDNSKNRYVGIWYKKITARTVVWVANTENPLKDKSGVLRVVESGMLVLVNSTNGIIWSTSTSRNVQNPIARLLDSGNLVVADDADDKNPENFLWQSFDYPTDTFLPGMKLGVKLTTGFETYLRSPKSSVDPSPGDYTFRLDPTGYPQKVIKKGEDVVFRTGPWNGVSFGWSPDVGMSNVFRFGVVMNKNEVYYYDERLSESIITRSTLGESGVGHWWIWVDQTRGWVDYVDLPMDNCDDYQACGPYGSCNTENSPVCGCLDKFEPKDPQGWERGNWSNGCVRSAPLDCRNGDVFLKYSRVKLPDTRRSWFNKSMTIQECKVLCSKDCSCTAYSSLDISRGENGCLLWFGDLVDIRKRTPGQDIYIRMASSEFESQGNKRKILIMALPLAVGIPLLSLSFLLYTQKRKRLNHHPDMIHEDLELQLFDLSKITKATMNFSSYNKLGEGGFGPVYKGVFQGQEIAVKCLSRTSCQGVDELKNEIICIAKLQHRNLVKLLGWCIHGEEMMLVYEYMANKSLDLILFDPTKSILLDWPARFNIINGIARGLMYLHQDSRLRVIHRDLKTSNILLDSNMNPKISDFGLARTFQENENEAKTSRVVGTYGYMSPEYATYGMFSVKSDVFSFGVLVLEIVTGKRNKSFSYRDHFLNLLGHAWIHYKEERSLELVDPYLKQSCFLTEVLRSIHIGLLCVQEHPEDRPSMPLVVTMLSNDSTLPETKHPGFFAGYILNTETLDSSNTASSKNTMTISLPEAR